MKIEKQEDIEAFIENKINESTTLEFKDSKSLNDNKEISKDISAMANSEGGVIIYGLCDDDGDYAPERVEWINDNQLIEKIEQIVQSKITPKIEGLQIKKVQNDKNINHFVIIVTVPKSDIAPHQDSRDSNQRRYWRRNGYTIRQMEHYEIEDLFFKRKRPLLEVSLTDVNKFIPFYPIEVLNKGKVIAEKTAVKILIPTEFIISGEGWSRIEEKLSTIGKYTIYQYFEDRVPFYPKIPHVIGILEHPNKKKLVEELKIGLYIVCKDMEAKIYEIILKNGSSIKKIHEFEDGLPLPFCDFLK